MRVAIVGAGISGLSAAYVLSRDQGAERPFHVTLLEAAPSLGGHTYTVPVQEGERTLSIDMGFIVFNERTYPGFCRLLSELGVASQTSDMSLSVRSETSGLEYNGSTLRQLFVQRRNLLRPSFHQMWLGILRFHRLGARQLEQLDDEVSLGDLVQQWRLPEPTVQHYIVPTAAAIWSTPPRRVLDYPARTLLRFLHNHGMLTVDSGRPPWLAVAGGSQTYVHALQAQLERSQVEICLGRSVIGLQREMGEAQSETQVEIEGGEQRTFDRVILALHSDQALQLLRDPSPAEREVLGAISYQDNEAVLHTDRQLLPRRQRAWASWNVHLDAAGSEADAATESPVQLTYHMNTLQQLRAREQYCVTLNRSQDIAGDRVLHRKRFAHPLYTREAVRAQGRWHEISGHRGTHYCGAYWGYGFHEDGLQSALRVCEQLGVSW